MILREFAYIDEKAIRNYLSTIEDGLVESVIEKESTFSPQNNFRVNLGDLQKVLLAAGIITPDFEFSRSGKSEEILVNRSRTPTIHSQFNQLLKYLQPICEAENLLKDKNWKKIKSGQILEFEGTVKLPKLYDMARFSKAGEIISEFSKIFQSEEDLDEEQEQTFEQMKAYNRKTESAVATNVYIHPEVTSNNLNCFVSKILNKYLQDVELFDLESENYKVLGRIEKVLKRTESYEVFDLTQEQLGRSLTREEKRKTKGIEDLLEEVKAPAVILKPIAIYSN